MELVDIVLPGEELQNAEFHRVNMSGANLESANLWGATFIGVNLRDASLRGVILNNASIRNLVAVDGAKFEGARMLDLELDEASREELETLEALSEETRQAWRKVAINGEEQ